MTDPEVKRTFKMIGRARNYDELGLPSWMKRFNGKPVIIYQSGEVFAGCRDGVHYLEEDVVVGRWSMWAKQGVHSLMPRYKEIDAEIGFVSPGSPISHPLTQHPGDTSDLLSQQTCYHVDLLSCTHLRIVQI